MDEHLRFDRHNGIKVNSENGLIEYRDQLVKRFPEMPEVDSPFGNFIQSYFSMSHLVILMSDT